MYFYTAAKQSATFCGLPRNALESCKKALQIFAEACSSIYSGDITAEVLHKIQQNSETFDAIARLTQNSSESIHSVLQQYQEQLQSFEIQKGQLHAVCRMLPDEVQGKIWLSFCRLKTNYMKYLFHLDDSVK